jgi:transposase
VILLDFLETGQIINSCRYIATLTMLKARISRIRPEKESTFLLQYDNATPRTNLNTVEHVAKFGLTVLLNPPYSPDLAPSDRLFGSMKDGLRGQHLLDNVAVIAAVRKWVTSADADLYEHSMQALVHRLQKCIASGGVYAER